MTSEILRFSGKPVIDESIQEYSPRVRAAGENKSEQCGGDKH